MHGRVAGYGCVLRQTCEGLSVCASGLSQVQLILQGAHCCLLVSRLTPHASRACRSIAPLLSIITLQLASEETCRAQSSLFISFTLSLSLRLCLSPCVTLPSRCFHSHSPLGFLPLALLGYLLRLYFHLSRCVLPPS